jgi:hypothetical protein
LATQVRNVLNDPHTQLVTKNFGTLTYADARRMYDAVMEPLIGGEDDPRRDPYANHRLLFQKYDSGAWETFRNNKLWRAVTDPNKSAREPDMTPVPLEPLGFNPDPGKWR